MARDRQVLRLFAMCRGEGVGYVGFCSDEECRDLTVRACTKHRSPVPCDLFVVRSAAETESLASGRRWNWVVVVPLLNKEVEIVASLNGTVLGKATFPALRSKVASRLLTMTKPEVARVLRGYELRHGSGRTQVRIMDAWLASDGKVAYRVSATFPVRDGSSSASLQAYGSNGMPIEARV